MTSLGFCHGKDPGIFSFLAVLSLAHSFYLLVQDGSLSSAVTSAFQPAGGRKKRKGMSPPLEIIS